MFENCFKINDAIDIKLKYKPDNYENVFTIEVDTVWAVMLMIEQKLFDSSLFAGIYKDNHWWPVPQQKLSLFEAMREALWFESLTTSIKLNLRELEMINGGNSITKYPTSHKIAKHIIII